MYMTLMHRRHQAAIAHGYAVQVVRVARSMAFLADIVHFAADKRMMKKEEEKRMLKPSVAQLEATCWVISNDDTQSRRCTLILAIRIQFLRNRPGNWCRHAVKYADHVSKCKSCSTMANRSTAQPPAASVWYTCCECVGEIIWSLQQVDLMAHVCDNRALRSRASARDSLKRSALGPIATSSRRLFAVTMQRHNE